MQKRHRVGLAPLIVALCTAALSSTALSSAAQGGAESGTETEPEYGSESSSAIYRWVDKNGKVHFGDAEPISVPSQEITVTPPPMSTPDGQPIPLPSIQRPADTGWESDPFNDQSEQTLPIEHIGPCAEARQQLGVLHEQLPVYMTRNGVYRPAWRGDAYQGDRAYLADEDRPAAIQLARNQILKHCSDPDDFAAEAKVYNEWIQAEYCKNSRAKLEAMENERSRTPASDLERQRETVAAACNS